MKSAFKSYDQLQLKHFKRNDILYYCYISLSIVLHFPDQKRILMLPKNSFSGPG